MVTVGGEIDLATAAGFEDAIVTALRQNPRAVVVDLSEVAFLASAGLKILVATHEKVSKSGYFAVVANGPSTSRPIQLTGLNEVFPLYPTLADAMSAARAHLS